MVEQAAKSGMDWAAEWVSGGTLAKGFTTNTVLLGAKGVSDIVSHRKIGFGVMLPMQEVVIMQELDIRNEEG